MMKQKYTLIVCMLFCVVVQATAQTSNNVYRKYKLYVGLIGGVNFTLPEIKERHSILVPTDLSGDSPYEKEYGKLYRNMGTQFGFYFSYGLTPKLSLVFQPNYQTYKLNYMTSYGWTDTVNMMDFEQEMKHVQKFSYFTLPVAVRWDFRTKRFSPYVQVGFFTEFRHRGNKTIYYDHTIDEEVDEQSANTSSSDVGITDHINKFNIGPYAGLGIAYNAPYFTIGLEGNFRYGLLDVVNNRNRYSDVTGFAAQYLDVLDQFRLANINVQMKLIFPINNAVNIHLRGRTKY